MNLGDTFLPRNPADNRHLYVVIHRAPEICVSVNFTTRKADSDLSCIVKAGEHKRIIHESVICYDREVTWPSEKIIAEAQYLIEVPREPVSKELLERIHKGALVSRYVAPWLRRACRTYL